LLKPVVLSLRLHPFPRSGAATMSLAAPLETPLLSANLFGLRAVADHATAMPGSMSRKDAKSVASCAEIIWEMRTHPDFYQDATSDKFWQQLLSGEALNSEVLVCMHRIMVVVLWEQARIEMNAGHNLACFGRALPWKELARRISKHHDSLQTVAAAVAVRLYPDAFRTPTARVLPLANADLHSRIYMFPAGGSWRFTSVFADVDNDTVPSCISLSPWLCPPSPHYLPLAELFPFCDSSGRICVEEGAAVHVEHYDFRQKLQGLGVMQSSLLAYTLLPRIFNGPPPAQYGEDWIRQKSDSNEPVIILKKFYGLTHPERPFAVSAAVVIIEDADQIQQIHEIAQGMGYDLLADSMHVPISFPPALSDVDRQLQQSHCRLALGASNSFENTVMITRDVAEELLGESLLDISELNEEEISAALEKTDELVRRAMLALRTAELQRRRSEIVVVGIIDFLVDRAWYDIKCRREWVKVNARVEEWGKERQRVSKNKKVRRRQGEPVDKRPMPIQTVKNVVEQLNARTVAYRHVASGLVQLVEAGLARVGSPSALHFVEDPSTQQFDIDDLRVDIVPPRMGPQTSCAESLGTRTSRKCHNHKEHFLIALQKSADEDHDLALAHRDEIALQVAMEASLCEAQDSALVTNTQFPDVNLQETADSPHKATTRLGPHSGLLTAPAESAQAFELLEESAQHNCVEKVERGTALNHEMDDEFTETEQVFLYPCTRAPREFMHALLFGPELETIRKKMDSAQCPYILAGSAAKIFVFPHQYHAVLLRLSELGQPLRASHVIVAESLLPCVEAAISSIPSLKNVRVKSNSVTVVAHVPGERDISERQDPGAENHARFKPMDTQDAEDLREWQYGLEVERTFICVVPCLREACSVNQSTSEAHGSVNPRRFA